MKMTLLGLAAGLLFIGCAREESARQWSALDPNGYRTEEPWQTHPPRPVDEDDHHDDDDDDDDDDD